IRHRLRPAALVLRARDAILRPDFHRHTDDFVALLTQKISGHAGVHSTAHAEKDTLFVTCHANCKVNVEKRASNRRRVAHGVSPAWRLRPAIATFSFAWRGPGTGKDKKKLRLRG